MTRTIALANQKGGVAKTTTTHALGAAFGELGLRALLVDLDPQACLTFSAGIDPDGLDRSLHDVFMGRNGAADVMVKTDRGLHLLPATIDLAGAEMHLLTRTGREFTLRKALKEVAGEYDLVLIDCPPSLGLLTINGLTAADEVLVPLQCETLSHRGVGQLLETIDDVRSYTNPDLQVLGAVATMYDGRTKHSRAMLDDIGGRYGMAVVGEPIAKSVRFAEAPARGLTILDHAPGSRGAAGYRSLARTLSRR